MGKKIKIKDIAETCGLSNTLVSMVLNNKASLHGIKPDTQEKVLYIARQMGYFEGIAENEEKLPAQSRGMVGMIVPALSNQFLFEIGPLLSKAFSGIGLTFSIISRNDNEQRFISIIRDLKKMFSGLILFGDAADDILIRKLKEAHYPFVVLEKRIAKHRVNEVHSDYEVACKLVGVHISTLGYKNISVIEEKNCLNCMIQTGLLIDIISNINPGIKIARHSIRCGLFLNDEDKDEIIRALRPPEGAQLMLVKHSELVYPLLSFLKDQNVRVPYDIALISMDNGIGLGLMDPPVTRINRKYSSLAIKASQMLWSEIKNNGRGKYKRSVKVSPELIVERSCGSVV